MLSVIANIALTKCGFWRHAERSPLKFGHHQKWRPVCCNRNGRVKKVIEDASFSGTRSFAA
jgi:hypothetical protein